MSDQQKTALCCVCGATRTCRRPRNHRAENYWLRGPVDRDWHRETGDLKCAQCGRVTTHAIVTGDDHAEKVRKAATGWQYNALKQEAHERIRDVWRQGLPRNPYMRHLWWISDEEAARAAGQSHFLAICKTEIPVPELTPGQRDTSYGSDELVEPNRFHDVEREDPDTGLWWFDVDCTDCLLRANSITVEYQRKALKEKLQHVVEKVSSLDALTVAGLLAQFGDNQDGGA